MKRYYFTQYGYVWSLTRPEAIEVLTEGANKGECLLGRYRMLRKKINSNKGFFHTNGLAVTTYNCLDFTKEDFLELLTEIKNAGE